MTPERWQQVARLYETALAREPHERAAFVAAAASDDAELRREVEALLAQRQSPLVIDRSLGAVAGSVIATPATLAPGAQLGPYRIEALLGEGGMGQVYRATDTRLNRTVAIKVLPHALASDAQFRARFEREAQTIAGLTHPHICTLHDIGEHAGTNFLVLEYLEGETLAARLERAALPFEQALACAIQIADALDAAHRRGIVHRDLKPGNIMLTRGGSASAPPIANLLDFGLAKPAAPAIASVGPSHVPTTPPALTAQGTILGTFQYMAPEQLESREADARTDIFAFGAVVYEMFTGKKAFEGKSHASLIGAIMHANPPPISATQSLTPPSLDHIVKKCLAKDPEARWQTAKDLASELRWVAEPSTPAPTRADRRWPRAGVSLAVGSALFVGALAGWWLKPVAQTPAPITRFDVVLPDGRVFTRFGRHVIALSPDGTQLAFVANNQIYLRRLGAIEAAPIPGADVDPTELFFSPDGEWLAFWAGGQIRKVPVSGGAPISVCAFGPPYGASWVGDTIYLGGGPLGIFSVPATGGTPAIVVLPDSEAKTSLHGPQLLPGGEWMLFTEGRSGRWDEAQIVLESLKSRDRKLLSMNGTDARYLRTGHLTYFREGVLYAIPFDLSNLETRGRPVQVEEFVAEAGGGTSARQTGSAHAAMSESGTLAYMPAQVASRASLVWKDRDGRDEIIPVEPRGYFYPRVSPDGSRIAIVDNQADSDIWVWDSVRGSMTNVTRGPAIENYPLWNSDGTRLIFASNDGIIPRPFWRRADGNGAVEPIVPFDSSSGAVALFPQAITPDDKMLIVRVEDNARAGQHLHLLSLAGDRTKQPLLDDGVSVTRNADLSPDARWLAYESNESGRMEVYVRPFPDVQRERWPVSTQGGSHPRWRPDGRELFFVSGNGLYAVDVTAEATFGLPRRLFDITPYASTIGRNYDVSRDGKRFVMVKPDRTDGEVPRIRVVQNWFEELSRRVPTQ